MAILSDDLHDMDGIHSLNLLTTESSNNLRITETEKRILQNKEEELQEKELYLNAREKELNEREKELDWREANIALKEQIPEKSQSISSSMRSFKEALCLLL